MVFPLFPELRVFQEWARHRYGVYPEHGYKGDKAGILFFKLIDDVP